MPSLRLPHALTRTWHLMRDASADDSLADNRVDSCGVIVIVVADVLSNAVVVEVVVG